MFEQIERILSYDEWCDKFSSSIDIELAESGADRELCFDLEREYELRYSAYLDQQDHKATPISEPPPIFLPNKEE